MPTITCTDKQLDLIETCVEAMFRLTMGQAKDVIEAYEAIAKRIVSPDDREDIEKLIRQRIFPELVSKSVGGFAAYSFNSPEIGGGRILGEMVKVMQNYRAKRDNHPSLLVTHDKPMKVSNEPLITVGEQ